MSRKIVMTLVCILVLGLSGCGDTLTLNQYNTSEIWYIAYACRMEHAVSDESFQKLKEHAMRGIAAQKIDNTFDNFPVKK